MWYLNERKPTVRRETEEAMKIKVLLFAGLAEAIQKSQVEIDIPQQGSVKDLKEHLVKEYPELKPLLTTSFASINQEYSDDERSIEEGDEVAFLPPVSGGSHDDHEHKKFVITKDPLRCEDVIQQVIHPGAGAVLTFIGTVREFTHGKKTVYLEYESYEPMAIKTMGQIEREIIEKWPDARVAIHHRIGSLDLEEISVIIAVATPHRDESFKAGRYAIERLKQIVPIWKKEIWEDGSEWKGHQLGPWNPTEKLDDEHLDD